MTETSNTAAGSTHSPRAHRAIAIWLLVVAGLVFAMVIVGGATRLTDSGLSITEWKPVTGAIPPLSVEAWDAEFEKYRQIPEYELVNRGMTLGEFKSIYYWEWGHRLLGRLIGIAFFLPFLFFLLTRKVERERVPRLVALFVLGGMQGALGWFMVMSGLSERVDVSQYRLAAHLGLAFLIYAALFWTALDYLRGTWGGAKPERAGFGWAVIGVGALIFLQIIVGGFVAGLDAGFIYNTWPLMDGALIPSGLFSQAPWVSNLFENNLTVQFTHRMTAYLVVFGAAALWIYGRRVGLAERSRKATNMLVAMVLLQVALGIWTLLAVVPLSLGLIHQGGAVLTLSALIYLLHRLWAKPA
jgi:cytochrome c oxidase assembly protein subunit 15